MEIVKQWILQSNLFEQHDQTSLLNLLIFSILSQSYHTTFTYLKYIILFFFFHLFSTAMFFLHCVRKILRQTKKFLYVWWINHSITRTINWFDSKYNKQCQIPFPFSRIFFRKNCVWSPFFLSGAQSFNLDIPGKTTSWITSICSTIWEEVDGTSSLAT